MGKGFLALGARVVMVAACTLALAAPASAEWSVYTSADLGFSIAKAKGSGDLQSTGPPVLVFEIDGEDDDVSPFLGGALGLSIPFGEATPWTAPRWLADFKLREEVEVIGLRSYKFTSDVPELNGVPASNVFGERLTEVDAWSVMVNTWIDIPLGFGYRPISWTSARLFGRWRLETLKQILARTSLSAGVGIGATFQDVKSNESGIDGGAKSDDFAWQAGGGIGYQLAERVNLGLGYRYIDPGSLSFGLRGRQGIRSGRFKIDTEIHEARATVRVDVFDFTSPWRWRGRR